MKLASTRQCCSAELTFSSEQLNATSIIGIEASMVPHNAADRDCRLGDVPILPSRQHSGCA